VITVTSLAASEVARLLPGDAKPCEFKEDDEDIADAALAKWF
jgi:hypothetical protein